MIPSTSKVGSAWVVGFEVSKQPPWSIATSTSTALRFISFSCSRLITCGALAPWTSTAPITRSTRGSISSIASVEENTVEARPAKATSSSRRRSIERSNTNTSASIPIAIEAALKPTAPPPITITLAAATPGTPPSRIPRPPSGFSRKKAPAWVAILPATSLIGASSGSRPSASSTVS